MMPRARALAAASCVLALALYPSRGDIEALGCIRHGDASSDPSGALCSEVFTSDVRRDVNCRHNLGFHPACKEESAQGVRFVMQAGGQVSVGDQVALVPAGSCDSLASTAFERAPASPVSETILNEQKYLSAELRAPDTWGVHQICVKTENGDHYRPARGFDVSISCPAGWYGVEHPEEATKTHHQVHPDRNPGTAHVVSWLFDAKLDFYGAHEFCASKNARLCSEFELEQDEGHHTAHAEVWSSTSCDTENSPPYNKQVGFKVVSSSSACAKPDCVESYHGERCWHDHGKSTRCADFDPANPASRDKCGKHTDWRLHWSPFVIIPKQKRAGFCMNGAPCGNVRSYTVIDGIGFDNFEREGTQPTVESAKCANFNASDVRPDPTNPTSGKLVLHGASLTTCRTPDLSRQVACCRGSLPVCSRCPFGLESPRGATTLSQCTMCIQMCKNESGTCACSDSVERGNGADDPEMVTKTEGKRIVRHAGGATRPSVPPVANSTTLVFYCYQGGTPEAVPGAPQSCESLSADVLTTDVSMHEACQNATRLHGASAETRAACSVSQEVRYVCDGQPIPQNKTSTEWQVLDPSSPVGSEPCTETWANHPFSCPPGWYRVSSTDATCEPCLYGLGSARGAVGRESCLACLKGCETSCGQASTCKCSSADLSPENLFGPLRTRATQELAFGQPDLGKPFASHVTDRGGVFCTCGLECTSLGMCDVDTPDCQLLDKGRKAPFWLRGGAATEMSWWELFGADPQPVAFCADVVPSTTNYVDRECCQDAGKDKYFHLTKRNAMGLEYDEILHPLQDEYRHKEVVQVKNSGKYIILREERDPLAKDKEPFECKT